MIRADASLRIGGGHVSRCMALAHRLADAGWECTLATRADTFEVVSRANLQVPTIPLSAGCEALQIRHRLPAGCDLLITDHYGLDAAFEAACRGWATQILAIDDLADRAHHSDWLLDQTPGCEDQAYLSLTPPHCRLLLGAQYALLRPEFARLRQMARVRDREARSILITFGATDPHDMASLAIEVLLETDLSATADVVVGAGASKAEQLQKLVSDHPRLQVRLHHTTDRMAELMLNADLCIGAGGVTALERCCLGLPTIIVQTAENQATIAAQLALAGAAADLGPASRHPRAVLADMLRDAVIRYANDASALASMSRTAKTICDGRGTWRTLLALLTDPDPANAAISLRLAEATDSELLFAWQSTPGVRRYFRNPHSPSRAEHLEWMQRVLADPERLLLIMETTEGPSGMVRLDNIATGGASDISILVAPEHQGQGIGKACLQLAAQILPRRNYYAEVDPKNLASRRLFTAAGYHQTAVDKFILPARLS